MDVLIGEVNKPDAWRTPRLPVDEEAWHNLGIKIYPAFPNSLSAHEDLCRPHTQIKGIEPRRPTTPQFRTVSDNEV